jgi:uncharacterized protein YjiS (DUF1127 family)
MLDTYRKTPTNYRPYFQRARCLRSEAFHNMLGSTSGTLLAWLRTGVHKLRCWNIQRRAEKELQGLNNTILKDIGVSRGEIFSRAREALPCS